MTSFFFYESIYYLQHLEGRVQIGGTERQKIESKEIEGGYSARLLPFCRKGANLSKRIWRCVCYWYRYLFILIYCDTCFLIHCFRSTSALDKGKYSRKQAEFFIARQVCILTVCVCTVSYTIFFLINVKVLRDPFDPFCFTLLCHGPYVIHFTYILSYLISDFGVGVELETETECWHHGYANVWVCVCMSDILSSICTITP